MNEELQEFFGKLARRFRSENDLSDFTYVALETIPEFKKDFVRFFYPLLEVDDEIEVVREFSLESSDGQPSGRPDFLLRSSNSWGLIVENKLGDTKLNNFKFDADSLHALTYFVRMIRATLDKLPTVSNNAYAIDGLLQSFIQGH